MKNFKFKNRICKKLASGLLAILALLPSAQAIATNESESKNEEPLPDREVVFKVVSWVKKNPKKCGAACLFFILSL